MIFVWISRYLYFDGRAFFRILQLVKYLLQIILIIKILLCVWNKCLFKNVLKLTLQTFTNGDFENIYIQWVDICISMVAPYVTNFIINKLFIANHLGCGEICLFSLCRLNAYLIVFKFSYVNFYIWRLRNTCT